MDIFVVLMFLVGFVLIIKGGDWFVEAAVWIAEITGIPKILIGATIVSLATTLPELLVSLFAVLGGAPGLGVGNAIGSIICNTGLILSIALIVFPPKVEKRLFLSKSLILVTAVIVLVAVSLDGVVSAVDSIYLFLILVGYIVFNIRSVKSKKAKDNFEDQTEIRHIDTSRKSVIANTLKFVFGAAGIIFGANLLVENGVIIAAYFGVSQAVIGLTVVALGTSLPELVTTITSLVKKHGAMGVGNIIGANVLNIVLVLSTCALASKDGVVLPRENFGNFGDVSRTMLIDIPVVALMFAVLIIPVAISKKGKLKRFQGFLLILIYISFIVFTVYNI